MSSVRFLPHIHEIKHIPRAIIEKVEAREQLSRDFQRCIAVCICPKCCETLISSSDIDDDTIYECPSCKFEYTEYI